MLSAGSWMDKCSHYGRACASINTAVGIAGDTFHTFALQNMMETPDSSDNSKFLNNMNKWKQKSMCKGHWNKL